MKIICLWGTLTLVAIFCNIAIVLSSKLIRDFTIGYYDTLQSLMKSYHCTDPALLVDVTGLLNSKGLSTGELCLVLQQAHFIMILLLAL